MVALNTPEVGSLIIDKLGLVFRLEEKRQSLFHNALEVMRALQAKHIVYAPGMRYRSTFHVELCPGTSCVVQFDPLQKSNAAFRFEFNPSKLTEDGARRLRELMACLFGLETESILDHAIVTTLDVAVDISNVTMECLYVCNEKTKYYQPVFVNGVLETIYLGSTKSSRQIRLYDKRKERLTKSKLDIGHDLVRLETSLTNVNCPLRNLARLNNAFDGVRIVQIAEHDLTQCKSGFRRFVDSCRLRGLDGALMLLDDPKLRAKYRSRFLEHFRPNWFNARKIWKGLPAAVNAIKIFPEIVECNDREESPRKSGRNRRQDTTATDQLLQFGS